MLLTACGVFQGPDTQATLEAEVRLYATEAAAIEQAIQVRKTQVQGTSVAAETQVWQAGRVNELLLVTARVISPPTQPVVAGVAAENSAGMMEEGASMQFVEVVTASSVRQSYGCAEQVQTRFSPDTARIYVVARVLDMQPGTGMGVEWLNEGQVAYADSWVVASGGADFCVWYFITAEDVTLTPGNWTVRLSAGGLTLGSPVPFTIAAPE